MAFILQNWAQDTVSANIYAPVSHTYITTTDTIATVSAANYFSAVGYAANVGDQILAVCSNGTVQLQVSAVNNTVNPVTISTTIVTSGGTSALAIATGTLTQANWLGMSATPVTILAAQGTGVGIIVESFSINYHFATAAFAGGGATLLQYGSTTLGAGPAATNTLAAVGFSDQVSSRVAVLTGTLAGTAIASVANTALTISNQTAAFTGGNALSTFAWTLIYRTMALT